MWGWVECKQSKLDNILIFIKFILQEEHKNVNVTSGSNKRYEVKQSIEEGHGVCVCVHMHMHIGMYVCVSGYVK